MTFLVPMFSYWSNWSSCSKSCDWGSKTRSRKCTANCHKIDSSDLNHEVIDYKLCATFECRKYISLASKLWFNEFPVMNTPNVPGLKTHLTFLTANRLNSSVHIYHSSDKSLNHANWNHFSINHLKDNQSHLSQ